MHAVEVQSHDARVHDRDDPLGKERTTKISPERLLTNGLPWKHLYCITQRLFLAALPEPVSDCENLPAIPTSRLLGARGDGSEI
jgi:hypothetical protein